ncbi:MAG: glycerol kinase GlpK [Eubacteriales bacterium]|nr:glycerol kinase GlpK [Eubacteriales bacterium]
MKDTPYLIAIDQGTTSTRALIFDDDFNILGTARTPIRPSFPAPGHVEQDAGAIHRSLSAVMEEAVLQAGVAPAACRGIGITNQRETVIIWDRHTGLPVYPAIVWQSRQSEDICRNLRDAGCEEMIRTRTGLRIDPYFSATKIRWITSRRPDVADGLRKGDLLIGTVDSWAVWHLSGGTRHITDITNASRTLLFNINTLTWDPELCALFDIPMHALPEIVDNCGILAETTPTAFFGRRVPITGLIGDQQAALLGQRCFRPGDIKNTYGTGGFLLMNTGTQRANATDGLLQTVAYKLDDTPHFALEGAIFVSGSLIQWLRDGLGLIETAADSARLAGSVSDSGGVVIVPAFTGLACPYWDEQCRGGILNLTRGTTKAHLVRAALEAMCTQVKDVCDAMTRASGQTIRSLRVDGGASANPVLLQLQADLLQAPVRRADCVEATALGAAMAAVMGLGLKKIQDFSPLPVQTFLPQMPPEQANAMMARWHHAVDVTRQFTTNMEQ